MIRKPAAEGLSAGEPKVQEGEVLSDGKAVFIAEEPAPDRDDYDLSREGEEGENLLCCHLDVLHF